MPENRAITIYCGECGAQMSVDAARAGKAVQCENCKAGIPVPHSDLDRPQIRLFCPKCGGRVRAWTDQAGKSMACPRCKRKINLPEIADEAKPEAVIEKRAVRPLGPTRTRAGGELPEQVEEIDEHEKAEQERTEGRERKAEEEAEDEGPTDIVPEEEQEPPLDGRLPSQRRAAARKVRLYCPSCGKSVECESDAREKHFLCPYCQKTIAPAATVVKEAPEKPLRMEVIIARFACEGLGILLLYAGIAFVGKGFGMGAWQEFIGLDAQEVRIMGMAMCVIGPVLLLIGSLPSFRAFLAAALTVGALMNFAYAAYLGSQGEGYERALRIGAAGMLMIATGGLLTAMGRKKTSMWVKISGVVFPLVSTTVLYPGIRMNENERAAVEWMKRIGAGEDLYKQNRQTDQDEDGAGEYGFLCELVGEVIPRASGMTRPVLLSYVKGATPDDFGLGASSIQGQPAVAVRKSGYFFRIYLPSPSGAMSDRSCDGTREKPGTKLNPQKDGEAIDLQEQTYVLYAWPENAGRTGRTAFAMNQGMRIFSTEMESELYTGDMFPEARAAYVADAVPDTFFNNAFGEGGQTFDKNLWRCVASMESSVESETGKGPGQPPAVKEDISKQSPEERARDQLAALNLLEERIRSGGEMNPPEHKEKYGEVAFLRGSLKGLDLVVGAHEMKPDGTEEIVSYMYVGGMSAKMAAPSGEVFTFRILPQPGTNLKIPFKPPGVLVGQKPYWPRQTMRIFDLDGNLLRTITIGGQ